MTHEEKASKLQVFRGILEAVIVAALLWTGSSLVALKSDTAVIKDRMLALGPLTNDVSAIRLRVAMHDVEIEQLKEDQKELKSLKGLK